MNRGGVEFERQSQISVRQRRIWGRNFKAKLLTFSVFSCFLPSIFIHLSIQHNLTLKRKKQENTEKVRSLVLKFLPKILLCLTLICDCFLNSMPPLLFFVSKSRSFSCPHDDLDFSCEKLGKITNCNGFMILIRKFYSQSSFISRLA